MNISKTCLGTILNANGTNGSGTASTCQNIATQLANAGIIAGTAFFTTLAGVAITDTTSGIKTLVAASISGGLAFFTSMSIQRNVNKPQ